MEQHELKSHPSSFDLIFEGKKFFEYRKDNRGFEEQDNLFLKEYDPETDEFTGREALVGVTLKSTEFGVPEGFCILGITKPVWRKGVIDERGAERVEEESDIVSGEEGAEVE